MKLKDQLQEYCSPHKNTVETTNLCKITEVTFLKTFNLFFKESLDSEYKYNRLAKRG